MAIPTPYRVLFTWVDGAISLVGAYIHFFAYEDALRDHLPQLSKLPAAVFAPFMYPIGGCMTFIAVIQLGVLRSLPRDVRTWKLAQLGLVVQDISILVSLLLILQGKGISTLREAMGSGALAGIAITGVRTIPRLAFLAGVGVSPKSKAAYARATTVGAKFQI